MLTSVPQFVRLEQTLGKYTLAIVEIDRGVVSRCSRELFAFHATFAGRKLHSSVPLRRKATRASHSPDEIEKYAFVVVLQVGQLVGEVGEVVANAGLQVLANMTIDGGQRAALALT